MLTASHVVFTWNQVENVIPAILTPGRAQRRNMLHVFIQSRSIISGERNMLQTNFYYSIMTTFRPAILLVLMQALVLFLVMARQVIETLCVNRWLIFIAHRNALYPDILFTIRIYCPLHSSLLAFVGEYFQSEWFVGYKAVKPRFTLFIVQDKDGEEVARKCGTNWNSILGSSRFIDETPDWGMKTDGTRPRLV